MPGRHALSRGRWLLPWLAGAVAALVAVLAAVTTSPAGAAPAPVVVTMGVTGATSSNCGGLSAGGSDVYVTPDGELDFTTTLVGVNLLGLSTGNVLKPIAGVVNLGGLLVIDPGSAAKSFRLDASKTVAVTPLAAGDHRFTFAFDTVTVTVLGLPVKLSLKDLLATSSVGAGVQLTYSGTIHVTNDAVRCGVALQLPGVVVSASVTGLPPIVVSVGPVTVPTIPLTLPTLLSPRPSTSASTSAQPNPSPRVSPSVSNPGASTSSAVPLPGVVTGSNGGTRLDPGVVKPSDVGLTAVLVGASVPEAGSSGRGGQNESFADQLPAVQIPVLLAILATIALSTVTASYARQRLLPQTVATRRPLLFTPRALR